MKGKKLLIILILLSLGFIISRLYNILELPIFTDEAIYIRWSQIARYDAAWRFISLTDGKQPSFVWATMNVMRFTPDPLLAGRLVSVGAGLASLLGLFFLGKELFKNPWVGILSSAIYLVFPMSLVYDRMALYEALVGAFSIWSLYLTVLLVRKIRLDVALILGMVAGGAVLTKTSGFFSLYLLPFSLLLFNFKEKKQGRRFIKWLGLAILAAVLAYTYYSVLRLSPFFHIIDEKNTIFVYPIHDWLGHPFRFFWGNLLGEWDWFIAYVTWPVIFLVTLAFLVYREWTREKLLLLIWFAIPFVALALFGRVLYPRFIFFMIFPLIPLAALSLFFLSQRIKNTKLLAICCLLLFALSLRLDYYILTNFARAPIPYSDLEQYINNWPAGGGIKEIISFLEKEADRGKIFVFSEGTFGSLPTYAVEIYLGDNRNVEKEGLWPLPEEPPESVIEKTKLVPVFLILNQTQQTPRRWPLKPIARYQKGTGDSYISLYQVLNER